MIEDEFSFSDILALPDPETSTETRTFDGAGKSWKITIHADGKTNADRFYSLRGHFQKALLGAVRPDEMGEQIKLHLPGGKMLQIEDPTYSAMLGLISAAVVSPKFPAEQWAVFGQKVGPTIMEDIADWVTEANGLGAWLEKIKTKVKNSSGAETIKNGSSAPASSTSINLPKSHSKA